MAQGKNDLAQSLAGIGMFRGLESDGLIEIVSSARRVRKARGEVFFRQGQEAKRLFFSLAGRVKISQATPEGHQIVVRYAGAGETFGCVPLYSGRNYPATAAAVTDCDALSWDHTATIRLMERYPRLAINALRLLGAELAEARARYQELATERVEQRVARALVRLVSRGGKRTDEGVLINFPLSRQDLAELTGTTLHTVSRILSGWEAAGIIKSGRQRVVVRKPHALVSIAEDLPKTRAPSTDIPSSDS